MGRVKMLRAVKLSLVRQMRLSPAIQTIKETDLVKAIQENLNCHRVEVVDISDGCGSNFQIQVVSDDFKGKRAVNRQRMVNKAIKPYLEEIHQLRVFTNTLEEDAEDS